MSRKKNNRKGEIKMINENEIVNENEIIEVEDTASKELVKEILGENEEVKPEGDDQVEPEGDDQVEPEGDDEVEPEGNDEEDENIKNAIVTGCSRLNVRKESSKESDVVCILDKDTELTVSIVDSTEEFYKVYAHDVKTDTLVEGYCVKDFITIK